MDRERMFKRFERILLNKEMSYEDKVYFIVGTAQTDDELRDHLINLGARHIADVYKNLSLKNCQNCNDEFVSGDGRRKFCDKCSKDYKVIYASNYCKQPKGLIKKEVNYMRNSKCFSDVEIKDFKKGATKKLNDLSIEEFDIWLKQQCDIHREQVILRRGKQNV